MGVRVLLLVLRLAGLSECFVSWRAHVAGRCSGEPTVDRAIVWTVDCGITCAIAQSHIDLVFTVGTDVELQRRRFNIIGVVAIEPSAARSVISVAVGAIVVLELAGRLLRIVRRLPTGGTNVSGPRTAASVVKLLNGDPRDTGGIVVVRNSNVLGAQTGGGLVNSHGQDATIIDVSAVGLASIAVARVEGVDLVNRALL